MGDLLATVDGKSTTVAAVLRQAAHPRRVVQIGDFLITNNHRVMHKGQWAKPITLPGARWVESATEIFNFITDDHAPFIAEGIIAASIGTDCVGAYDPNKALHCLWNSPHIVALFRLHPKWPEIEFEGSDAFLAALSDEKLAEAHLGQLRGTVAAAAPMVMLRAGGA